MLEESSLALSTYPPGDPSACGLPAAQPGDGRGFRLSVAHFSRFSVTYGSIGAVVMHLAPDLPKPQPAERPQPEREPDA